MIDEVVTKEALGPIDHLHKSSLNRSLERSTLTKGILGNDSRSFGRLLAEKYSGSQIHSLGANLPCKGSMMRGMNLQEVLQPLASDFNGPLPY